MDLLKLEEDISERLMIELGDELRTEYLTFATTFVMEEIKKHLEVKNNGVLDDVKECLHPFNKVVSGDEGDFCTECQKYLKTNKL